MSAAEPVASVGTAPREPERLTLDHVSMRFGEQIVVSDCSLTLEPGGLTAMVGPSGCGKSTIAFLVAGYHRASAGEVRLGQQLVTGPSHERLLMFQETALLPWLTTLQNVMFGPQARGAGRREARRTSQAALERVGLAEFADSYPHELSGGMQRRAELARALVTAPRVLVLDEPFRGLDAMTRARMQEYFAELSEESSAATLFITTDVDEAILLADRLLIMSSLPARVHDAIEVDLPRPRRREEVLRDPRAAAIKERALGLLHAEAMRSFDHLLAPDFDRTDPTPRGQT